MGVTDKITKMFATLSMRGSTASSDKVAASKTITNDLVGFLLGLSDFKNMKEEDIYEQIFIWEPEIGGVIDRISAMVSESYKYPVLKNTGSEISDLEKSMLEDATKIADSVNVKNWSGVFTDILEIHGNLYLEPKDGLLNILPNKYVTIIDKKDRLTSPTSTGTASDVIMEGKYLVLYEGESASQRVLDNFIHIRYKDTPVYVVDSTGRTTYNIYSLSPLHRVVLYIWWKRIIMLIDVIWRARNVPREHHKIDAEMFSLDKYAGDITTRRNAAVADARTFLDSYVDTIKNQMPDQGYATLSTVEIDMIDNKSSNYMQTNELMNQLNEQMWAALNIPKSMITGESTSSYSSELVVADYMTQKVNQIIDKIKPTILDVIKERLLLINSSYPVEQLDLKYELSVSPNELESFRQAAIMAELGVFTETEIRELLKYKPLRDDQRKELVKKETMGGATSPPTKVQNPETSVSHVQHATDAGQGQYKKAEG